MGRFVSADYARSGYNWYIYCSNNPIILTDPLGLFDYDTRLSANQEYNDDVAVLQNELAWLGYMNMPGKDEIGYYGSKTLAAVDAYKTDRGLGNAGKDAGVVGLQTWQSLGLTYRTKADINADITIKTIGLKQYKDVSAPLNKALNPVVETAKAIKYASWAGNYLSLSMLGTVSKGAWFVSKVNHEKSWDIKVEKSWNETIANNTFPGEGVNVYYNGMVMNPEELGNYTYGYIGHAVGFNIYELYAGSWVAAGFPTDDEGLNGEYKDWKSIKKGFDHYN